MKYLIANILSLRPLKDFYFDCFSIFTCPYTFFNSKGDVVIPLQLIICTRECGENE